ncbi:MAG: tibC [Firmicutes bacterium]|nr:tibC [Bacillota bacterium]
MPEGNWRVKIIDRDSAIMLYDAAASNVVVTSTKKYYVNFRIEVYKDDKLFLEHNLDLKGKKVLIKYPVGTLGDIIAWFPYARAFKARHGCEVYCAMAPELAELFKESYPELIFIGPDERPEELYASYYMGIFFPCDDRNHQPVDWRIVGLQKTIPYILGLKVEEIRPVITPQNTERLIKEPYVCIAAQATSQAKYWTNPNGWLRTVEYLKAKGYRVLCIDKEMYHGCGSHWNFIPYGAENFTGAIPLRERVNLLYHADFFVGLASGLSWLAWAVGKPVALVSGFSLPVTEFYTPYRVINYHVCNGCWTDSSIEFEHKDFTWCPRHKNTDRQFECTRFITAEQVNAAIDRLMADHNLNPKPLKTEDRPYHVEPDKEMPVIAEMEPDE